MKERISTLMDGELFEDETEALLGRIKHHPEARQEWQTYHLIGDALRQPGHIPRDISVTLRERLQREPAVLAPRTRISQRIRYFAMSAAASLMALALVAWMSVQISSEPATPQIARQQPGNLQPGVNSGNKVVDDYLMAHQEVSPSTDVQGAASYIHTVAVR
jgi:sigma-E factor negative regulatory protein RseA